MPIVRTGKNMKKSIILTTLLFGSIPALAGDDSRAIQVGVKDGWFVVNGERFFVKGIGYQLGYGPGQHPMERSFDPEVMEHDLALLKQAGFNTVRSWNVYSNEELQVLRKHGMMVIQGSWFSFERYLRDEAYAQQSRERLAEVIRTAKRFDHILFHTITNEPHAAPLINAGMDAYGRACRELKGVARHEDPDCLVTYSHCSRNEFLDQSAWDVIFFNDYMYAPNTVRDSLKYRGHVQWLREMHAAGKPFVLGEFGLSVSKSGKGNMGYGGNTLEEQRDGALYMLQSMIDAGGQGGCLFMWTDGWWKCGDRMTHDDHAEEWYGVLGIDTWESDPRGTPRPVYYAFKKYNQLILTEPRQMVAYQGNVPVDAYVTRNVTSVRCRVDGGPWTEMRQSSPSWRKGNFGDLAGGRHTVEVEAPLDLGDTRQIRRVVDVIVGAPDRSLPKLTLTTERATYDYGDKVVARVCTTSADGSPLPNVALVGTYQDHGNGQGRNFEGTTDASGVFETSFQLFVKPTFITLAAGADTRTHGLPHRLTDATIIEVTGLPHAEVEQAAGGQGRLIEGFEYATKAGLDQVVGRVLGGAAEFAVGLEATEVKQGLSALALRFKPNGRHSWGFAEILFGSVEDVSGDRAISYWLHGDGSHHSAKVMLIDKDGERWLDEPVLISFRGWRRIVFSPKTTQRDPHDGIEDGDGRPNPEQLAGLAFAMVAGGESAATIIVDAVAAHE